MPNGWDSPREIEELGDNWRSEKRGPRLAVRQIVSGLIRELVCVVSQAIVGNSLLEARGIHSKKGFQLLSKDLSC